MTAFKVGEFSVHPERGEADLVGSKDWLTPPRVTNHEGQARRIGIELEFAGPNAVETAAAVQNVFGGTFDKHSDYRITVRDTDLGDFLVELDFAFLHKNDPTDPLVRLLGEVSSSLVPMEIACPPVSLEDAPRLEELRSALQKIGAEGTRASVFYALGLQINPELPRLDIAAILSQLRAFILLRDWLRDEIAVDTSRQLLFFAAPFPADYCDLVLHPDYQPDQGRFIDDYLRFNPTRNRELDLLPLLAQIDATRVRRELPSEKINARPTFHYRLPNTLIDEDDWSIGTEWNRWVAVEQLAEKPDLLERYGAAWREANADLLLSNWLPQSKALRAELEQ